MPMTPVGKRRTLVTIQARAATKETDGQPTNSWTTFKQVYARVQSLSGTENYNGGQFSPEVTHKVTMLYVAGVTPMHRLLTSDGKMLDILTANYGERQLDDLVLICKERLTQAGDLDVG